MNLTHTSERPPGLPAYKTDRCRCTGCSAANLSHQRRRALAIANGTWKPFVDAQPVRDHLAMLAQHGIGFRRAAYLSGVSSGTISHILYAVPPKRPRAKKVRAETAALILSVRPAPSVAADYAVIDATGYRRRMQALVARGFTQAHLAKRLGESPHNFEIAPARVLAYRDRAARALYDELWDQDPLTHGITTINATRARCLAEERGWPPPAAWDDATIDDPDTKPDRGAKARRQDALAEDAQFIAETSGASHEDIAARLGITCDYLEQVKRRAAAALAA